MLKVARLVRMAQLVAYIGCLGHFTAIVANFAMSLVLVQALPQLSPKDSLLP